ncbi:MAG: MCP four helix bundle domain-containing protein [Deltaproteobacteria bacterium]|nr:MCP four helix bundle domain-containing protein [Deltaproteobacteria bacterium]
MGIRVKILLGFLILTAMLFIAGFWSVYELTNVGESVQNILDDNYRSINSARVMVEALEREDSAILLLLSGKWKQGRDIMNAADRSFRESLKTASANVTISGEEDRIDKIDKSYSAYKEVWIRPIVGTNKENSLDWYFSEIHPAFVKVKEAVFGLMSLNEQVMYKTSVNLKEKAHRAVMPGVIAIIAALVFTLIFNYMINHFVVSPLLDITSGISNFLENGTPFTYSVETNDELYNLSLLVRELMVKYEQKASVK